MEHHESVTAIAEITDTLNAKTNANVMTSKLTSQKVFKQRFVGRE